MLTGLYRPCPVSGKSDAYSETSGSDLENTHNSELLVSGGFIHAVIADLDPTRVENSDKPASYECDLRVSNFKKSNLTWAGASERDSI